MQFGYGRFGSGRGSEMFPTIQGEIRSPELVAKLARIQASVTTLTHETNSSNVIEFLVSSTPPSQTLTNSLTETRFNRSGMERKTTSDFGFIGWIIAQLNDD